MDNPHLTTFAHELALSVLFQSGITHFADKPEGYLAQPEAVQQFLKNVPVTWDDIKFLQGEPGKYVVLARRSGENWYIAGINGLEQDKIVSIDLNQFDAGEALFIGDKEARALTYRNIPEEHRS